jgi:ABC-2 type transport system ATP-binding protein
MKEVVSASLRHRRLDLKLTDEVSNTAVLAQVFQTLCDNKVALVSVRTVGMQTEQAYLDLVEKEESRGFTRLYSPAEAA